MIRGIVSTRGLPVIVLRVAGSNWPATVDTGFNGDLELPMELRARIRACYSGHVRSRLANGQYVEEDRRGQQ